MTVRIKFYSGSIVSSVDDAGPWYLQARDVAKLRAELGDELLVPFAELFLWADRLAAIAHLLHLNKEVGFARTSLTTERDAGALIAYGIGAVYEAAHAILKLRRAGVRRLVPHSKSWAELDAMRRRWRDQLPLRDLRNEIAFHASPDKIKAGLDRYVRKRRRLLIVGGDRQVAMYSTTALGPRLLFAGLRFTRRALRSGSDYIARDIATLGSLTEQTFIDVMNAKGLMIAR